MLCLNSFGIFFLLNTRNWIYIVKYSIVCNLSWIMLDFCNFSVQCIQLANLYRPTFWGRAVILILKSVRPKVLTNIWLTDWSFDHFKIQAFGNLDMENAFELVKKLYKLTALFNLRKLFISLKKTLVATFWDLINLLFF